MASFNLPKWNKTSTISIEKSISRSTTDDVEQFQPQPQPPSPRRRSSNKPVTNTQAALQVAVNFLVMFNSFGLIQSFGIFQLPYELALSSSPSAIAWIGSIHIFLVYFLGTFSGFALDAGYYRLPLAIGSALQVIGLVVAGFSKSYGMTLLFHGVFQGVGHGLMFCPTVTTTAYYFRGSRWKMMGLGVAGCGTSVGGVVFPAIARSTINSLGIGPTLWIMCGVVGVFSILIQVLAWKAPTCRSLTDVVHGGFSWKRVVEWRAFKDMGYTFYVVAMFFVFLGLWIPFFYVREFSARALEIPKERSFFILIILNATGIPGRIIPALLADRFIGTINTYIIVLGVASITLLCWLVIEQPLAMYPWAALYGFGAGGVSSLLQAGITSLNQEPHKTGVKIGMAFTVVGFASLVGGPVGGVLLQNGEKAYPEQQVKAFMPMITFTGCIMLLGCMILVAMRFGKTGCKFRVKM